MMVRLQIQLTESQLARIDALARRTGTSRAAAIRAAVEQHLANAGRATPPQTAESPCERAVRVLSRHGFRSGGRGLSQEHDEAFAAASEHQ